MRNKLLIPLLALCVVTLSFAYVVKKGDTLWDLSDEFFQNPFTWPELWANNPHIENPHLIYPGDSLNMTGEKSVVKAQKSAPNDKYPGQVLDEYPDGIQPGIVDNSFKRKLNGLESKGSVFDNMSDGGIIFETRKNKTLPHINIHLQINTPKLSSNFSPEDWGNWISLSSRSKEISLYSHVGDELILHAGKNTSDVKKDQFVFLYSSNSIQVLLRDQKEPTEKYIHKLVAIAKVKEVANEKSSIQIINIVDEFNIKENEKKQVRVLLKYPEEIVTVKKYDAVKEVTLDDFSEIIWIKKDGLITQNFNHVVIDKGTAAGYEPGDGIIIWENAFKEGELNPQRLANGIVISASEKFATVLVRQIFKASNPIKINQLVSINYKAIK